MDNDVKESTTTKKRQAIAKELRYLANMIEGDDTITGIDALGERPPRELDPLRDECVFPGWRQYVPGPVETWTIRIQRDD
jgi:hypothetical protein